jgi:hypothetical protein
MFVKYLFVTFAREFIPESSHPIVSVDIFNAFRLPINDSKGTGSNIGYFTLLSQILDDVMFAEPRVKKSLVYVIVSTLFTLASVAGRHVKIIMSID